MPDYHNAPTLALTRFQAIWLYVSLSVLFAVVLHVASDAALMPQWARYYAITVLSIFSLTVWGKVIGLVPPMRLIDKSL